MKFIAPLAAFASVALAQNAHIAFPHGATATAGDEYLIQIQQPDSLTSLMNFGIAIGISSCAQSKCLPAKEEIGDVLYAGPFNPEFHQTGGHGPYQNFTVKIPKYLAAGKAQINVAHAYLLGASLYPVMNTLNETMHITK
ncbi:hypothetical protein N7474_005614 [Penicillium riverlandense]|uniref:uncharacterized protein n=1 Tax=Penicillium riverlandense TaxID=1903569 RepID=UPI002547CBEA|nr:uncharacterized protein N7474_005614 [Penicillium riverlandense]KAJ5820023.1 hypothetical protein N7474_005614 [Penicillium riverlandense]